MQITSMPSLYLPIFRRAHLKYKKYLYFRILINEPLHHHKFRFAVTPISTEYTDFQILLWTFVCTLSQRPFFFLYSHLGYVRIASTD